ncbi:MAG: hypothetical protein IPP88_11735 [Betaproteobacteria bacterium]|nr:hypothetical protein [Betaproteobacteria bacterium]
MLLYCRKAIQIAAMQASRVEHSYASIAPGGWLKRQHWRSFTAILRLNTAPVLESL